MAQTLLANRLMKVKSRLVGWVTTVVSCHGPCVSFPDVGDSCLGLDSWVSTTSQLLADTVCVGTASSLVPLCCSCGHTLPLLTFRHSSLSLAAKHPLSALRVVPGVEGMS